ncbi:hypothetical protein D6D24_02168 [Aureobasidium pullulans]|uniref:Uncharacterized protein n=1 Tax=Aureobasidium pullulans TaxID=5580 RepID=A0A4S9ZCW4_AURPU|nr:hypothetical protein D6D24_02168 [Aureobasidium pullulans]TIA04801.1 hypothetical protein D6C82_00649 [Aureobasidium pullulans]
MASIVEKQLQSLLDGFDALRLEYQRVYSRCATLESQLYTAKSQYSRLADQSPEKAQPLDLSASPAFPLAVDFESLINSSKIVDASRRDKITAASRTTNSLRSTGVAIHSGPSADKPSAPTSSAAMPSISESPLEQDFTVPGTPSRLDCPFASMERRKLSSHAASVVSRYKSESVRQPRTSGSRINGRRGSSSARNSVIDPIREVCAMDSHKKNPDVEPSVQGSSTDKVCPIRFLDQHSPEEVAAYFELHKHELPRSHEICVKRYQSNEEQIRQLDAKYGNIVSMIQGLGQKHVSLLPENLGDDHYEAEEEFDDDGGASNEKIRKWASTVYTGPDAPPEEETEEDRLPRFDRPLRDVRLGESPSRPWGIQVPIDARERQHSVISNAAAATVPEKPQEPAETQAERPKGRCPFGFDEQKPPSQEDKEDAGIEIPAEEKGTVPEVEKVEAKPTFIRQANFEPTTEKMAGEQPVFVKTETGEQKQQAQMVFTGPVFIGYSVQEAMAVLQSMQKN